MASLFCEARPADAFSYASGTVRYTQTTTNQDGRRQTLDITKSWDEHGFVSRQWQDPASKNAGQITDVLTPQGPYAVYQTPNGREVRFGVPNLLDEDSFLSVSNGRSAPLGAIPDGWVHDRLPGRYRSKSSVYQAVTTYDGRLESLKRLNSDGSVRSAYSFEGKLQNTGGGFIPQKAVYRILLPGHPYTRSFVFHASKIGSDPKLTGLLDNWNQPGSMTTDSRVKPDMVWTYADLTKWNNGNPRVTPDQLLILSRKRREELAKEDARLMREHGTPSEGNRTLAWIATILVTLFALTYLVPFILNRRARKNHR